MRFGIIGCGSIAANSFAPSLVNSEDVGLVAVCRRDGAKVREFAQQFGGCSAYDNANDLLAASEVEAVIVATPTDSHCEYTLAAAQAGKHVLCEKPMARDRHECRRMIEACKVAGVALGVAYRRRLFPQVGLARELITAGRIGRVVSTRTHYAGWGDLRSGAWQHEPGIGGALMEMAVHRVEVLLNLAPAAPVDVMGLVETVHQDWQVDDSDAMLLRFADGTIGVHSTIMTSRPRRDFVQVDGTEGRIFIDPMEFDSDQIEIETPEGRQVIPVQPLERPFFDQPMIEDFARAAAEGREPQCDGETGYVVQAVADAARESAASGQRITLDL
ncbi:MAG: Gfo/Idh/MocA family oxidoreductase [Candidatus Latescibacterota bacterium]|nr:Gfo/Idh/MocA family oxidoreductase [Candidatus Latescibacterota bacterium]